MVRAIGSTGIFELYGCYGFIKLKFLLILTSEEHFFVDLVTPSGDWKLRTLRFFVQKCRDAGYFEWKTWMRQSILLFIFDCNQNFDFTQLLRIHQGKLAQALMHAEYICEIYVISWVMQLQFEYFWIGCKVITNKRYYRQQRQTIPKCYWYWWWRMAVYLTIWHWHLHQF